MKVDYGNLRRRRRDASWQWTLVGLIGGGLLAMGVCVGGYALNQIRFPPLEGDTPQPSVQHVPSGGIATPAPLAAQATLGPPQEAAIGAASATTSAPATPLAQLTPSLPPNQPQAGLSPSDPTRVGAPADSIARPQAAAIPPPLEAIKTRLALVPGGTFSMGTTLAEATQAMAECARYGKSCADPSWVQDSTPPHPVTVDSFQLEIYEVSITQYIAFLNWKGPHSHQAGCQGYLCVKTTLEQDGSYIAFDGEQYVVTNPTLWAHYPAVFVTWYGAVEYCQALHRRLPTEAEWERAARGTEQRLYPWGMAFEAARANSAINDPQVAAPVDSYTTGPSNGASEYGVYNLAGNAAEWVLDWYQAAYYSEHAAAHQVNPPGPPSGVEKVVRGGSWDTVPLFLRTVHRMSWTPHDGIAAIGFRCAADAVPGVK